MYREVQNTLDYHLKYKRSELNTPTHTQPCARGLHAASTQPPRNLHGTSTQPPRGLHAASTRPLTASACTPIYRSLPHGTASHFQWSHVPAALDAVQSAFRRTRHRDESARGSGPDSSVNDGHSLGWEEIVAATGVSLALVAAAVVAAAMAAGVAVAVAVAVAADPTATC